MKAISADRIGKSTRNLVASLIAAAMLMGGASAAHAQTAGKRLVSAVGESLVSTGEIHIGEVSEAVT